MRDLVAVYDHPKEAQAFVEQGLWHGEKQFGECTAFGFANERDGFVAGFVYHNYAPEHGTIELSAYSTRRDWCTRERLRRVYDYPFEQLGARMVVARHSARNKSARRIWRALGASQYAIPDLRAEGEAEIIATLRREHWQQSKFKQKKEWNHRQAKSTQAR